MRTTTREDCQQFVELVSKAFVLEAAGFEPIAQLLELALALQAPLPAHRSWRRLALRCAELLRETGNLAAQPGPAVARTVGPSIF